MLNPAPFGRLPASATMAFGLRDLIAHAARCGLSCLSGLCAIDAITVRTWTPFRAFGDRVRITARIGDGMPFDAIDQRVVRGPTRNEKGTDD